MVTSLLLVARRQAYCPTLPQAGTGCRADPAFAAGFAGARAFYGFNRPRIRL
jgi:hypothetical protein